MTRPSGSCGVKTELGMETGINTLGWWRWLFGGRGSTRRLLYQILKGSDKKKQAKTKEKIFRIRVKIGATVVSSRHENTPQQSVIWTEVSATWPPHFMECPIYDPLARKGEGKNKPSNFLWDTVHDAPLPIYPLERCMNLEVGS